MPIISDWQTRPNSYPKIKPPTQCLRWWPQQAPVGAQFRRQLSLFSKQLSRYQPTNAKQPIG
ncbi:MAG TPA: hypothetical protein DEB58_00995 [Alphaproteobacteria bacterium]|nr:hypothetical protein [Alphaproteobacteria bacterium]